MAARVELLADRAVGGEKLLRLPRRLEPHRVADDFGRKPVTWKGSGSRLIAPFYPGPTTRAIAGC